MDHEMWRPQIEVMKGEFRCIAFDERGFGQTESDDAGFDYWDLADDVVALLDHLGIDKAALVGLSQGGFLGMRMALRHPERVTALVLADTDPHAFTPEVQSLYRALFENSVENGTDDVVAATLTSILFAPGFDATYWTGKWRSRPPAALRCAEECLVTRDEIGDRLAEITCPVLVVHGELDAAFPIADVPEWAACFAQPAEIVTVSGAGHSSTLEKPDVVNPAVRDFLLAAM